MGELLKQFDGRGGDRTKIDGTVSPKQPYGLSGAADKLSRMKARGNASVMAIEQPDIAPLGDAKIYR